jgi:cytochrome c-type biogenesis protein CcmI
MVLWSLFAIMTLAASVAVLWPLIWSFASQVGGNETAVYKDQLAEVDRDVAAGLIGVPEVEATRVEIGRRLLAAVDGGSDLLSQTDSSRRRVSVVLATVLVAMPLAAAALYSSLGSPWLSDFPMASRFRTVDATQARDTLSAQVEEYLAANPTVGNGSTVSAPELRSSLARVSGSVAPALSSDVMAGARDMSEDQRSTMVRSMVDRLATRLKKNGDDVEGWVRLVQAYLVLGERDKAANARSEARQAVGGDANRLHQLNDGLRPLGFDG